MSIQPVTERTYLQDLRDPVLLTAFNSQMQGGATAASAMAFALGQWDAQLVAEFEASSCYINARMRPWVRRDGDTARIDWPSNLIYRVEAEGRTVLVLIGVEPSLNWREFVESIADFAVRHGVRLAISVKSAPAGVPHTLQAPVRAVYSDRAMVQTFGVEELEEQDGPADIGRVLNIELASNGCQTIDLYALEPFYSGAVPDAEAAASLLRTLNAMLGLRIDTGQLEEAAVAQRRAIDTAVQGSERLRETVLALEQRTPGARLSLGEAQLLTAGESSESELDPAEVLQDVEHLLRSPGDSRDD